MLLHGLVNVAAKETAVYLHLQSAAIAGGYN